MGLFSRRTHIGVASSVYNLAGDIEKRPKFLKETLLNSVFLGTPISESLIQAQLKGPAIRFRNFNNWAENNYNDIVGFSTGSITSGDSLNLTTLAGEIPTTADNINIITADIGIADYSYWGEQFVAENYPLLLASEFIVNMKEDDNEITITFEDTSTVTFTPTDFDKDARYIYVAYVEATSGTEGATTTGATIILDPLDDFPDTTGWVENSNVVTSHTETLYVETTVDVTYSDATPPTNTVTTTSSSTSYDEIHAEYEQNTYVPPAPEDDEIVVDRVLMYQDTTGTIVQTTDVTVNVVDIGGGVLRTTTTTVVTDVLEIERSYREDTLQVTYKSWSNTKVYIYKENSGNAVLDEMFKPSEGIDGGFYPFIPFRIDNKDVKDHWGEEDPLYLKSKKAFKKATGSSYDDVRENIITNDKITEIDYCYAVFGTSLNTKENASKKYIYSFFKMLMEDPNRQTAVEFNTWVDDWTEANNDAQNYINWRGAPLNGSGHLETEPGKQPYPVLPRNSITIGSSNPTMNYNVTLKWCFIDEETGSGLLDITKKKGDLWFTVGTSEDYTEQAWLPDNYGVRFGRNTKESIIDVVYLNWQVSDTEWKQLTIRGLEYVNMIYGGKFVNITSKEALETVPSESDTGESGFIIPLHDGVYQAMSLKDRNQMSTACAYLVFNVYQTKKEKWYQTAFFRFVLTVITIIVAVLTVMSGFADGGSGVGFLSGLLTVTLDIKFQSILYYIALVAVNAVSAAILTKIFQEVGSALFGNEFGEIIGTVAAMFFYMGLTNSLSSGQSLASSFGELLKADNIWKLTFPIGDAYSKYFGGVTAGIQQENFQLEQEFKTVFDDITAKTNELFGTNGILDPTKMIELLSSPGESRESFLQRTLMVGSDIANMSITMLNNFTEITLSTKLPNA